MNKLIALGLLAFSSIAFADDSKPDYYLDMTLASYHFCARGAHPSCPDVNNERNWGLGTTIDFKNHWEWKAGGYKNSYSKNAYYTTVNYYREWFPRDNWRIRAGLQVGLVYGYKDTSGYNETMSFANHEIQVGALPTFTVGYKRARASFGILGEVITLQAQYLL